MISVETAFYSSEKLHFIFYTITSGYEPIKANNLLREFLLTTFQMRSSSMRNKFVLNPNFLPKLYVELFSYRLLKSG